MTTTGGLSLQGPSAGASKRVEWSWALILFVIVSVQSVVYAETTFRRIAEGVPESNERAVLGIRRVMEPAFVNAGAVAGLEIWRVEDFKPVAYPKSDYGKFYTGDSYIVLNTKERLGNFSWDIHFWLGSQTSQDEAGAAAILTVTLDDQLGGTPVQYREVQDHESQLFLSYFKSGLRYLPGGVASGFTHVDHDEFEKRLFHVKGKRNIRVKQVAATVASMNRGDCFILDVGKNIYVYVGSKSKRTERLKAIMAANQIRDQDHAGRSIIQVIDEYSSESETEAFFTALGSGSAADVPDESAGGDDELFESAEERVVMLYRVTDRNGKLEVQQISQKPLRQGSLDTNDCFILDTVNANLYVWIGKQCNKKEKDEAMSKAQGYLTTKQYPMWTQVIRVVEGAEPTNFRQYFQTWQGTDELQPRLVRSLAEKPTKLAQKSRGQVPELMPDDGSGEVEIFRVENLELVPVNAENYGKFFGGDSYVIKYKATNGQWFIYIWQGKNSSIDERAASAIHAITLDNELGGKAIQIRAEQDYEPAHFLLIFKGKLITFLGGHASGFKNLKDHDTYVEGETRLYRIRGTSAENVRASQQSAVASSLESDDVFIVENGSTTWMWIGNDSDEIERDLAKGFVEQLVPGTTPVIVAEGSEPEEFWQALGGQGSYTKTFENEKPTAGEPRLYHVKLLSNGKLKTEEVHDFEQSDLDEDDVMILDSGEEVYVWIGNGSSGQEIKESFRTMSQYLMKNNRGNAVVITIKQGKEPKAYTSLFSSWAADMWESLPSYLDVKANLVEQNKSIHHD